MVPHALLRSTLALPLLATLLVALLPLHVSAGCDFYTNCAACVADTTCGWCGNDAYHAGGYGFTAHGDHNDGYSNAAFGGGIGRVYTKPANASGPLSGGLLSGAPLAAGTTLVFGINTVFSRQFRGFAGYASISAFPPIGAGNPFKLAFTSGTQAYTAAVYRVWNDTVLEVESPTSLPQIPPSSAVQFTLGTPRGTGGLAFGDVTQQTILPGSGTVEQLTVVCLDPTGKRVTDPTANICHFARELKPGYLLIVQNTTGPIVRTITSIISDVALTVDADFTATASSTPQQVSALGSTGKLSYSGANSTTAGAVIAANNANWTYVACPPRVGKRAYGVGTITSSFNQGGWGNLNNTFQATAAAALNIDSYVAALGTLGTASGGATGMKHRIVGSSTRFSSQFGASTTWSLMNGSGALYGFGPYISVQINGDWETQKVVSLGNAAGGYDAYFAILENSFSEPLLKATPFSWYTMLEPGLGNIRSYGKRVVAERWASIEPWEGSAPAVPGAQYSTSGAYGQSRFTTQLRTGYTITACGQTRTVNSIQSDMELTIDRPFTNGNREFFPASSSTTSNVNALSVRGLTRTLPLWPRGVTVQFIVVQAGTAGTAQFKYNVWWKTFMRTDDGDGNAVDDLCPGYFNTTSNSAQSGSALGNTTTGQCSGILTSNSTWFNLKDPQLQQVLNVYIKWSSTASLAVGDEWRLHVGDIQNCPWLISREGERYLNDDNANPPVCYNHGQCLPISSGAQNASAAGLRPSQAGTGQIQPPSSFIVTGIQANSVFTAFTTTLSPGDIVRVDDPNSNRTDEGGFIDMRVAAVLNDTAFVTDSSATWTGNLAYTVLKCAAGRRYDSNASGTGLHDLTGTLSGTDANSRGLVGDSTAAAYLPHPALGYYQSWSYKYCEVDPGCCGFRVASVVAPQAFAYYSVKPDHGNYNLRIATFTVNDNLDMYTRRNDHGGGRPDMTAYDSTSVRESVPWAIDEDASGFACNPTGLGVAALGVAMNYNNATIVSGQGTSAATAYAGALALPSISATAPDCVPWTIGIMGDNKYPQTVGASEYVANIFLEFNYQDFQCPDSLAAEDTTGLVLDNSHRSRCIESGLRLVRDADVVASQAVGSTSAWVVRLTESMRRNNTVFLPWTQTTGPSYPMAQRSGAVWWNRKEHLADGFETNFVFQITDPTQCGGADKICDGADGFAFVMTNDPRQETASSRTNNGWDCYPAPTGTIGEPSGGGRNGCDPATFTATPTYLAGSPPTGLIGCPADGLGYANSKKSSTVNYYGSWQECTLGLNKAFAVEFDLFYNVERRDPKQGIQHWWINATEYISYNDNHVGVFSTTDPFYNSQPWGAAQTNLLGLHSDDENGAHYGSTPSVPTLADFQPHNVKIRYTRGFTTEKQGSGKIRTTDISSVDGDGRLLQGDANTKFKSELRTGFEFGYANRVKANVKVKLLRDASNPAAQGPSVPGAVFGDDGLAVRVIQVLDDFNANLEETSLVGATPAEQNARVVLQPAFSPDQSSWSDYMIIKEFPGEIQVFIDDMDRYAFQVAVEDRDMAKVLDGDGNAYIGLTASTGSRGFSLPGYDPEEVAQTHDILAWNFCNRPGCVPY